MKINLLCIRFIKGRIWGVERVTLELAKEMKKQGHDVLILTRKMSKDEKDDEEIEGISIHRVGCMSITGLRTISSLFKTYNYLKEHPADINNPQDWSPTLLFLLKNLPYVMTSHGFIADYDNPNKISVFMEKLVLAHAKKPLICVQNRSNKTDYIKKYELTYIPNGVNTDYFSYSAEIGKYALFVGGVNERKNIERICQAFYRLKKEGIDIPLKVVGEGPLKESLSKKYPFIEFLGAKDGKELIELYSNCKFFVLPSNAEGFGLVWLEAMASGKSVIASSVGVGPEIIISKEFGRLVKDPKSLKEITKKIKELNAQIDKGEVNPQLIRDFVIKNYSWENVVKKYLEIYQSVIKK